MTNVLFINNDDYGNNIRLQINDFTKDADTYYFALDNFVEVNENKEEYVFNLLIKQWKSIFICSQLQDLFFLPFDFSDQYIGCIKVKRISIDSFEISYGSTTKFQGYSISPSDISMFIITENDFIQTSNNYIEKKSDIIFLYP